MLRGDAAPWEAGGQQSGYEMMLGRRYFMATNDMKRCEEQLQVLVVEKRRLASYFAHHIAKVDAAISSLGELDFEVPDSSLTVAHGHLFTLKQHAQQFRAQQEEVRKELSNL